MSLTVALLGSLRVTVNGRPIQLTVGRLRTLLAVLALSVGEPVSVGRITIAMWGDNRPDNARRTVQIYVARLRQALGADLIGTDPTGYSLRTQPDDVDAVRFARLLDSTRTTTDTSTQRTLLDEALRLWRGPPFDGLRSAWLNESEAPLLTERYLAAVECRADLDIAEGRSGEIVVLLQELATKHPLRESLWVRLLVALRQGGRHAEALERYETIRIRLAATLGANPGPELREVHTNLRAGGPPWVPDGTGIAPRQILPTSTTSLDMRRSSRG